MKLDDADQEWLRPGSVAQGEVDRLRALVKKAEWGTESYCPWCNAREDRSNPPRHYDECVAFTPDGAVK
jgi:hypothetical protein